MVRNNDAVFYRGKIYISSCRMKNGMKFEFECYQEFININRDMRDKITQPMIKLFPLLGFC